MPPYGESSYERTRSGLALAAPGKADGLLKLDGTFGLHPALKTLHGLYQADELVVLQAIATSYRERSHFDGQDILENGTAVPHAGSGWLNRALLPRSGAAVAGIDVPAMALAQSVPMVLRGDVPVESWAPSPLPSLDPDTLARLAALYRDDAFFGARLSQALATDEMAKRALGGTLERGRRAGRGAGRGAFTPLARAAAAFLSAPDGPRIAVLEFGGWDTHANQGAGQGRLATQLATLDSGVQTLRQGLGTAWSQTAVIVVSEFGRTVAENGTRGTDHGTAGAAFLLGGAVRGGRVVSDWPGIRKRALYQGRDLMPTLDARSLFKGVLRDHLGVRMGALEQQVFPRSAEAAPLDQLIVTPAARERSA